MPRAKTTIRFCIGTAQAPLAPVYSAWAHDVASGRATSSNVYISARILGGHLKVSLHQDGRWRYALTSERLRKGLSLPGWNRTGRVAEEWHRPPEIEPGLTRAFTIRFPASELRDTHKSQPLPPDVVWLPRPPHEHQGIVTVLLAHGHGDGWPGKDAGTALVGAIGLMSGETVFLVYHTLPIPPELSSRVKALKAATVSTLPTVAVLDPRAHRIQVFAEDDVGIRCLLDLAIDDSTAA